MNDNVSPRYQLRYPFGGDKAIMVDMQANEQFFEGDAVERLNQLETELAIEREKAVRFERCNSYHTDLIDTLNAEMERLDAELVAMAKAYAMLYDPNDVNWKDRIYKQLRDANDIATKYAEGK